MSDGIKLNQGIVTSLADTDLVVAADSVGSLRPITLTNLLALIRSSIKIGGRNLLKGANTDITSSDRILIGKYEFGNSLPVKGETYTLSLCYTLKGTSIRASLFGGEIYNPFTFTTNGERIIEQKTMFVVQDIPSYITSAKGFQFYRANTSDTYPAVIHWAVLTKGNLGVVDWYPAPEDSWGVKRCATNSCRLQQKGGQRDGRSDNPYQYSPQGDNDRHTLRPGVLHRLRHLHDKRLLRLLHPAHGKLSDRIIPLRHPHSEGIRGVYLAGVPLPPHDIHRGLRELHLHPHVPHSHRLGSVVKSDIGTRGIARRKEVVAA